MTIGRAGGIAAVLLITINARAVKADVLRIDLRKDCGASGDGMQNDTLAFQRAASLLESKGGGVLNIPPGTYLVGEQLHVQGASPYYQQQPIFQVRKVNGLTIKGNGARIKMARGLRFGAFDKSTGEVIHPKLPFIDRDCAAGAGIIFDISQSRRVEIRDLDLDGNSGALQLGGEWGDTGRQLNATGLQLFNNRDVVLKRISAHHHGLDGVMIGFTGLQEGDEKSPYVLNDCQFEYNGRQGLSWVGGRGLRAVNCKFNHTGRGLNNGQPLCSAPGAGLDIEAEDSITREGEFIGCEFIDNAGPAMGADSGDSGYTSFTDCVFWGTTNYSAWCRKPGLAFMDCRFFGTLVHAYSSERPELATRWVRCQFEDRAWENGKVFGQNGNHYLVEINGAAQNVVFEGCSFKANTCKAVWLDGVAGKEALFRKCRFTFGDSGLPDNDFLVLWRNVRVENAEFHDTAPAGRKVIWNIEAQKVETSGRVLVSGDHIRWNGPGQPSSGNISETRPKSKALEG